MPTLDNLIHLFQHFKYLIIFPVSVVEGPIITIISGFLSSVGQLNFWLALGTVALGDLVGDSLYYALGRFGHERFVQTKFGRRLGLSPERVIRIEKHFEIHPWKTFTFGKFAHGTGSLILVASGIAKVPYWEFLGYNIPTTLLNSSLLIVIGYFFGHAYNRIDHYLTYYSYAILALVVIAYFYFIYHNKFFKE